MSRSAARVLVIGWLVGACTGAGGRAVGSQAGGERACDRDVEADLLTVADRMTDNRLEAAHAYLDALLDCEQGRAEPRVFLLLAEVDERLGRLNEAHRWLTLASQVAGEAGRLEADVAAAEEIFLGRWVRVDLVAVLPGSAGPELVTSGPVVDDVARQLLAELAAARSAGAPAPIPITCWLSPGEYLLGERTLRLLPGTRIELPAERTPPAAP